MDSDTHKRKRGQLLEYAIYAVILGMTGSCALMYKTLSSNPVLASFTRFLAFAYVGFLALVLQQLSVVRRKRRVGMPQTVAPPVETPVPKKQWQPPLGLTIKQFAIVAFVFATACVTFTVVLSILR